MIIASYSKKDPIKTSCNYKIIYQKIKEEIKSVVITKLLNQVETLSNNYQKLLKENALIKNDLIYILKRVLLNKKEYDKISVTSTDKTHQMKSIYSMPYLTNASYINCKSYNSVLSSDNIKENNNIRLNRRYSIDDDNKKGNNSSMNNLENSSQFNNIQNKVDHYLNSLYRHNFAEDIISGTTSIHLLNKDKSLYYELFPKNNKNQCYINTDTNYRKISNLRKNKKILNEENGIGHGNNNVNEIRKLRKNNNYLKVQRKNYNEKNKNLQIRTNTNTKIINSDSKNLKNSNHSRFSTNKFVWK